MKNSQSTKEEKSFKISCWAIALSVIAIILFFWVVYILCDLYQAKNLLPVELKLKVDKTVTIEKIKEITDSISYANQVGRLDVISLLLGFLGVILGFAAIFGFLHIKETSKLAAREETEEWMNKSGEKVIWDWLNKNPDILKKAATQYMDTMIGNPESVSKDVGNIDWQQEDQTK